MKPIISERKQRIVSIAITVAASFLGFEALSLALRLYQLQVFALMAVVIYGFHFFWLTFIFDLHLKQRGNLAAGRLLNLKGLRLFFHALKNRLAHLTRWDYFRHYANYLILPGLLYWSTVVILMLNPFRVPLKQTVIAFSTASLVFAYMYFKRVFDKRMEHHEGGLKVLSLAKLYCAYLCLSAAFGLTVYFGLDGNFLVLGLGLATFLLIYQALFQHDLINLLTLGMIFAIALAVALTGVVVYSIWDTNYFSAGLLLCAVYNLGWGLLHHFSDRNLTARIFWEYTFMSLLLITMILVTHDFRIRIG
ncbi:MAG: hypothetical protein ACM3NH_04625 [Candidatus Saccharibacteria bacterium]